MMASDSLAGCTLTDYAADKALPLDFLIDLGLSQASYPDGRRGTVPALRIPYRGPDGEEVAAQFRVELHKRADGGDQRFRWQKGHKPQLYGLWRLEAARRAGYVVVPEGPSDAQTLWLHDVPALALSSASSWQDEWVHYFDDIPSIIVVLEPDAGGEAVKRRLAASEIRKRVSFIHMTAEVKDVSALYLQDPATFRERWQSLVAEAAPWADEEGDDAEALEPGAGSLLVELSQWAERTLRLSPLERELARSERIAGLKNVVSSPARIVDAALDSVPTGGDLAARDGAAGSVLLSDPELWPDEVDGEAVLDELSAVYSRYLALPNGAADLLALWTTHTHCFDASSVTPRLGVSSPEKRCGKTKLLTICMHLSARPLPASNVTSAVVFRAIEKFRPTLLIDEADTFLRDKEELRGVLNSGHTRALAVVVRTVGENFDAATFSTWAPVAIAQIGRLPATLEDRAVVVQMRRRTRGEVIEPLTEERLRELESLRRRVARWAADNFERLRVSKPEVPEMGSDRAADNWRPLLAIADLCGNHWPERARQAARLLRGAEQSDDGAAIQLLGDLRELFASERAERLPSDLIVKALGAMEERPWPEWRHAMKITARQVAALLRPFDIHPKVVRIGSTTPRGYDLTDFADAFSRYLPVAPRNSATVPQNGTFVSATEPPAVAHEKPPICRDVSLLHGETGCRGREDELEVSSEAEDELVTAEPAQQAWSIEV